MSRYIEISSHLHANFEDVASDSRLMDCIVVAVRVVDLMRKREFYLAYYSPDVHNGFFRKPLS